MKLYYKKKCFNLKIYLKKNYTEELVFILLIWHRIIQHERFLIQIFFSGRR